MDSRSMEEEEEEEEEEEVEEEEEDMEEEVKAKVEEKVETSPLPVNNKIQVIWKQQGANDAKIWFTNAVVLIVPFVSLAL